MSGSYTYAIKGTNKVQRTRNHGIFERKKYIVNQLKEDKETSQMKQEEIDIFDRK